MQQTTSSRDSANQASAAVGGSGITHYNGSLNDMGTMTVNIMGEQADKGLIVVISEQGKDTRKAPPATCVVYGNTTVLCDPNKTVNTEEYTLLRFLASNFIDPNKIDAKQHWNVNQAGPTMTINADYTITKVNNNIMSIDESRSVRDKSQGQMTSDIQTKVTYDYGRAVPNTINEYVTQRVEGGVSGSATTIYQTSLQLVSDSLNKS